jgi:hypothetical protein
MSGPVPYPEATPPQGFPPFPPNQGYPAPPPLAGPFPGSYPGTLPPPVQYRKRKPWRSILISVGVVAVTAGSVGAALTLTGRSAEPATGLTAETAQPAIQDFLDALATGDDQTVARHTLCGLYDEVSDRSSDLALADMAGEAFRKQFREVEVVGIDKLVPWSTSQAQALFTLRVIAPGSGRASLESGTEMQAVAQLLQQDDQVLVCSYVQRTR